MAPSHDRSFRFELRLPHRAKEIDFQFHGSKGFIWGESTRECHAHRGISNIAKNSAITVLLPLAGISNDLEVVRLLYVQ